MLQRPGQDASVTARAPAAPSRGRALLPPAPGLSGAQQPGWVTLWLHRLSRVGRETGRPSQAFVTRHVPRRPPRGVSFVTCHRLALLHVLLPLGQRPGGAAFGQPRARRSLKNWDSVTLNFTGHQRLLRRLQTSKPPREGAPRSWLEPLTGLPPRTPGPSCRRLALPQGSRLGAAPLEFSAAPAPCGAFPAPCSSRCSSKPVDKHLASETGSV